MILPKVSEKNLRHLLECLNGCTFDTYVLHKYGSKWAISSRNGDTGAYRGILEQTITTREAIIALCLTLETMQSIRDKAFNDGYDSAVMDNETPGRGEG